MTPPLACTICGRTSFAKLRIEITGGAATYLVCTRTLCISAATDRAEENLLRAADKAHVARRSDRPHPDAIDTTAADLPPAVTR